MICCIPPNLDDPPEDPLNRLHNRLSVKTSGIAGVNTPRKVHTTSQASDK